MLLEEFELWDITKEVVTIPIDIDPLDEYNKNNVKEKHIILNVVKDHIMPHVKDHIMPHVTSKNNSFDMWEALMKLYQSNNHNRKMVLGEKLINKITKTNNVIS